MQERRNVCICNMHACQAYLRHANYHSSLQNRARVLPSGALFEYFLLSPFFTQTVIYFLTTHCSMKVSPNWAQHGNSMNLYSTVSHVHRHEQHTNASITFTADKIIHFFRPQLLIAAWTFLQASPEGDHQHDQWKLMLSEISKSSEV